MKKPLLLTAAVLSVASSLVYGQQLAGTSSATTGGSAVVPGLVTSAPGTFLAQGSVQITSLDFSNFLVYSATIQEAVFRNSSGGVDFYYQLQSPVAGQNNTDAIMQFLAADFGSYATSVGFRPDGTSLNAAGASGFQIGTAATTTAQRIAADTFGHNAVTFSLAGLVGAMNSVVMIVSTNASSFTNIGDVGIYPLITSNGTTTSQLGLFSPSGPIVTPPAATPEGGTTALLLLIGVAGLISAQRMIRSRDAFQS